MKKHIEHRKKNASYRSIHIQNEIIAICGDVIKADIVKKVKEAEAYSVLADETADISGTEQLLVLFGMVNLPHYKRAASTSRHCIYSDCGYVPMHLIPTFIKNMLIVDYNYYVPRYSRVCHHHLFSNTWRKLPGALLPSLTAILF